MYDFSATSLGLWPLLSQQISLNKLLSFGPAAILHIIQYFFGLERMGEQTKLAQSMKEQSPVWQTLVFQTLGEAAATGFRMSYRLAQRHRLGHLGSYFLFRRGKGGENRRIMILNDLKTILRELKSLSKQHFCMTRQGKYDRISSDWSFIHIYSLLNILLKSIPH